MSESLPSTSPVAYFNGEFIPFEDARLPIYDLGIVQAATVTERLRTVRHRPYLVNEHLTRLTESLSAVGWRMPLDMGPIEDVIAELVRVNSRLIPEEMDLSVVLFVTAGQALADSNGLATQSRPTVCAYTAPLPLKKWAECYQHGLKLRTPSTRQMPGEVVSPLIKNRSRLHWFLAEQEVRKEEADATALLLDQRGFVTETASGNLFVVRSNELMTPRPETTLAGIAQEHVIRLAKSQGWSVQRADLTAEDVASAEEAFLTSSTYCILPVSRMNGASIGKSVPGRVTKMLIDNWSEEIGMDFEHQALAAEV